MIRLVHLVELVLVSNKSIHYFRSVDGSQGWLLF